MFELNVVTNDEKHCTVEISGEIDLYTGPDFRDKLYSVISEEEKDFILDLSKLNYIDSMGLGLLVGALKRVKEHQHNIIILNPQNNVRKLFRITGLDRVFIIKEKES
ncbi:MAG: STAS domain-containing protein [Clostridiaceae bacterium]|nr:STAS domain-containing protein [Clostridiaceae bacterium]